MQDFAKSKDEEGRRDEVKRTRKWDSPCITTFLTSLLTMGTSDSDLSPLLSRWGDIFSVLSLVIMVMVMVVVSVGVVFGVWW